MKNNECRYCGVPLLSEIDVCQSCQFSITQNQNQFSDFNSQTPTSSDVNQGKTSPTSFDNQFQQPRFNARETVAIYPQPPKSNQPINEQGHSENKFGSQPGFYQQSQNPHQNFESQSQQSDSSGEGRRYGNCLNCQALIHPSRVYCPKCLSQPVQQATHKTGGSVKNFLSFILLLFTLGSGGFYLYNNHFSANKYLSKYDSVTGGGNSAVLQSFSLKGKATITVTTYSGAAFPLGNLDFSGDRAQTFSFEMFSKKPNKLLMDYFITDSDAPGATRKSIVKQGYNGVKSWKMENIPNKQPSLVESNEPLSEEHMVAGLGNYQAAQLLTQEQRGSYPPQAFSLIDGVTSIKVDEKLIQLVGPKVYVHVRKSNFKNGFNEAILAFDENSGFLIGTIEKIMEDGKVATFLMITDNYKKTFVKENGIFGLRSKTVLMPHLWNMRIIPSQQNTMQVLIKLDIASFDTDVPLQDNIFEKPVL